MDASLNVVSAIGSPGYFEEIHHASADPFGLFERPYEQRKRALCLAMLARPRYQRVFEPGCSVGALSLELAGRAVEVVVSDRAEAAVARTRANLAAARCCNVVVEVGEIPEWWPEGNFDLVVLGEIGYYLSAARLETVCGQVLSSLASGGELLAVHWRPPITNCELTGDEVHATIARSGFESLAHYEEESFLADLYSPAGRAKSSLPQPG